MDPFCVATTGAIYCCDVRQTITDEKRGDEELKGTRNWREGGNFFKSAVWSADGTSVVTNSADNRVRTFVLPPTLLTQPHPTPLAPYTTTLSSEPIYALTLYPAFTLTAPNTTLLLSSVRDHPIRLTSALSPAIIASYPLIHPTTERYITPHSLLFQPTGTHFVTGSDSQLAVFDLERSGQGPVTRFPTIPSKRRKIVGGGVGMKGIVSSLAISDDGLLAAGTFTRQVGLYDSNGSGEQVAVFSVKDTPAEKAIQGKGVTQVLWGDGGRYLYIAERGSDGILVFDVRVTGKLVGWLKDRNAPTCQRLGVDLIRTATGEELWAGGIDGIVRVWRDPSLGVEEGKEAEWEWKAHDDAVSGAVVHPLGGVVATCSGQRHDRMDVALDDSSDDEPDEEEDGEFIAPKTQEPENLDNSLKIWSLYPVEGLAVDSPERE